jgi:5-methylcytosine-specific restriction endonuclease McrA
MNLLAQCPRCRRAAVLITRGLCSPCYRVVVRAEKGGYCPLSRALRPAKRMLRCHCCGRDYLSYDTKAREKTFCSRACQVALRSHALNPNWRGGPSVLACRRCHKQFAVFGAAARNGRAAYCSRRCKVAAQTVYPSAAVRHREAGRRREARERAGKSLGHHSRAEWLALLEAVGHRCVRCGRKDRLTRDHVIPLSKGGDDRIENIQPLCHWCNARKGARVA